MYTIITLGRGEIFTQIKQILFLGGELLRIQDVKNSAFNSLPSEIKEASSLAIFKRLLKGHFT